MWSFFQKYFYKIIQFFAILAAVFCFLVFYFNVYLVLRYVPEEDIIISYVKEKTLDSVMDEIEKRAQKMESVLQKTYPEVF